MIYTALDDFYLSAEELEQSPSRQNGVDDALESRLRRYGCDAMAEAVVLLHLPQAVACTAQVLLHRFYCKRSLATFDVKVASIAAFWLGAKLEEVIEIDSPTKLRLRDILMVFYRIFRRKDNKSLDVLDPYSSRYDLLKTEVVRTERHMLRAFGFIVHVEHPHRFVLTFGQLLGLDKELLQQAWNLANDSLRIPLCVRYKAEVVACGLLFLAARRQRVPMPENPPWWEVFGVDQNQLLEVARSLVDLLGQPKAVYVAVAGKDYTSHVVGGASTPVNNPALLVDNGKAGGVEEKEKTMAAVAQPAAATVVVAIPTTSAGQAPPKVEAKPPGSHQQVDHRHRSKSAHKDGDDYHKNRGTYRRSNRRRSSSRGRRDDRSRGRSRSRSRSRSHSRSSRSRSRSRSRERRRRSDRGRYRSDSEERRYRNKDGRRDRSRDRRDRR